MLGEMQKSNLDYQAKLQTLTDELDKAKVLLSKNNVSLLLSLIN